MSTRSKVPEAVKLGLSAQAVSGQIDNPDLARLTAHFFEVAGGERAVARILYHEFCAAAAGSVVRQRILDMILRATKFTSEQHPPLADLGSMSEDDLQRELNDLLGEATNEKEGQRAHQEPAAPAAAPPEGPQGPGAGPRAGA